jgi:hypothetical protein
MTPEEAKRRKMVEPYPGDADPMQHVMLLLFGRDVPLLIHTSQIVRA